MKKLFIALLVLGGASLEAYNRTATSVPYYNGVKQKMVTMSTRDWKETSFLRYADEGNWNEMLKILNTIPKDQRKAFVNTGDRNNENVLFRVIISGHPHLVSPLIKLGVDPLKHNSAGVNILEGAAATIKFLDPYLKNKRLKKEKYKRAWGH